MSDSLGYPDPLHPYGPGSRAPLADTREMPACYPIKGNVRDDGIRYYHRPDSRSYRATKAEVWFDSPSAAEAAGFTLAPTHGDGTDGVSYEPGGSNHPCTAATVEANRAAVRALAAGTAPAIAPLVGAAPQDGRPRGEDGMDIEPGSPAHDTVRHPYGVGSHAAGDDPRTAPVGYPIKGNVRRDGSRRYHRPDSTAYGTTNAEIWFDSPTAAEAAGFSLAASHPRGADPSRFEPGGDGHSWSRAEVGEARVRALYGGPEGAAEGTGDDDAAGTDDADADARIGPVGLAAGAAALAGTAALAGAAALGGADGGDAGDAGRSAAEKLGATTLELPGRVAAAATAGEQVTTRLSRPAGRGVPDPTDPTDPAFLDDADDADGADGAAAYDPNQTVKAPDERELTGAGPARPERVATDASRRAAAGGAAAGGAAAAAAGVTSGGVAAGRRLTALSGGRDGNGGEGRRPGGVWAWLAAAAAAVVLLGLLLSMCGGSANTNEATGDSAKGTDRASSVSNGGSTDASSVSNGGSPDASSVSNGGSPDASSAPAGPGTSAAGGGSTTAQQSTTQSTSAAAPSTTAAPAGPSTSVDADDDLEVRALAALDAAGFKNVQVEVTSGRVRITGNVPSTADASKAEGALNGMSGLSGVDNALVVAETPTADAVSGDPRYTG